MQSYLSKNKLRDLFLNRVPLIDVRAPVEYVQGALPLAVNLPLLEDNERAMVGTIYKTQGSEAAIQLGHQLVSAETKERRIGRWREFIMQNPDAVIYCFRGGLRSQIVQGWLAERGLLRPLIVGGYKAARNFLLEEIRDISQTVQLRILSGRTGSGKTKFLKAVQKFYPVLDLEELAMHRGSAFGAVRESQPTQVSFENSLTVELMRYQVSHLAGSALLVEDESHLIGRRAIPLVFFETMRRSPLIWIEETLEKRIDHIFQDYVVSELSTCHQNEVSLIFDRYRKSVAAISRKLGGLRAQEIMDSINQAQAEFVASQKMEPNQQWIEKLLVYYYDPMYSNSLARRELKYEFKGTPSECVEFLKNQKSSGL